MSEEATTIQNEAVERMFQVGAHFGYSKTRRHPSVSPFIFGSKNRVEIFDLEKTSELLDEAKAYVEKLGRERKVLLFVGGKSEARDVVAKAADKLNLPYVASRWIGGTITNFPEIKKRIDRLAQLTSEREKGELAKKYTKKEQLLIDREIDKLEETFGGLRSLERVPDALYVVDTKHESIAIAEARRAGIPIIGLSNSDCNLKTATYPLVGNDATMASITFFTGEIAAAYERGRESAPAPKAEEASTAVAPERT